jgi:hypothetical protein
MATITTTIDVGEGAHEELERLLSQFPNGQRLRVMMTEEEVPAANASAELDEYRARVAAARKAAPKSPWQKSDEALRELREGEDG